MRIDKYLKETKLIRRRKTSKDLAQANRVDVNGNSVKPSYSVKLNDVIEIKIKDTYIKFKVIIDPDTVRINQIENTFEVLTSKNLD